MHDLHWTLPLAQWSAHPASLTNGIDIGFINPIVRRRLSSLSRVALKVAHDCIGMRGETRVIFASRHGELKRSTEMLEAITRAEPVSPTAFSLSVLSAVTGVLGMVREDRSAATAISAGTETLGYALLEAYAQWQSDRSSPVLVVYADEPADGAYGAIDNEVHGGALAILFDATAAAGTLHCRIRQSDVGASTRAELESTVCLADGAASGEIPCTMASDSRDIAMALVDVETQSDALLRCLEGRVATEWSSPTAHWEWSWHESGA